MGSGFYDRDPRGVKKTKDGKQLYDKNSPRIEFKPFSPRMRSELKASARPAENFPDSKNG